MGPAGGPRVEASPGRGAAREGAPALSQVPPEAEARIKMCIAPGYGRFKGFPTNSNQSLRKEVAALSFLDLRNFCCYLRELFSARFKRPFLRTHP